MESRSELWLQHMCHPASPADERFPLPSSLSPSLQDQGAESISGKGVGLGLRFGFGFGLTSRLGLGLRLELVLGLSGLGLGSG